jgi:hypothetical protein
MFRIRSIVLATAAIGALIAAGAGPAAAAPTASSLQQQIDEQLRLAPGGTQTSANQIAWRNGTVVMTFPQGGVGTFAASDCPAGWFCFWQHSNFEGRRLQFSDCGQQDLVTYGFRNQTSSWRNRTSSVIAVWQEDVIDDLLWTEPAQSQSSYVGAADNDRADYFNRLC